MREVTVAVTQMKSRGEAQRNLAVAEQLAREASAGGANIILLPELFETDYFCQKRLEKNLEAATTLEANPAVARFRRLAAELEVVVPISFFEKAGQTRYNSLAVIDADGSVLGLYRKSHIPDGPGYSEKFYFSPGDTGFRVWPTRHGTIGCAVCWDQWFPEAARCLALLGAEMILYPTAIGSEPDDPAMDSMPHWRTVMQGHAAANLVPVLASNRVGDERRGDSQITFYGSSFITDERGGIIAQMDRHSEGVRCARLDLEAIGAARRSWGLFRDRRPDLYGPLLTLDGVTRHNG